MTVLNTQDISLLAPLNGNICELIEQTPLPCFSQDTFAFIAALSRQLLNVQYKQHAELVALGFWLRDAQRSILPPQQDGTVKPLGIVVHFTPTNVDTMFVYSWIASLLMGNVNIVRVATQTTVQQTVLLNVINTLLDDPQFSRIQQRNCFIRYAKHHSITAQLSRIADVRVIWGGDETVMQIKAFAAKPRTRDICFADRYSVVLINGDEVSNANAQGVALNLFKDIQPYSQQACSSPRVLIWLGSESAQSFFLQTLNQAASTEQRSLTRANEQAVFTQFIQAKVGAEILSRDSFCVVKPNRFYPELLDIHTGNQCLLLLAIDALNELENIVDTKCQTLSYFGFEKHELIKVIEALSITGIDRVVPVGQALNFDFNWDGYELLQSFSRSVRVL